MKIHEDISESENSDDSEVSYKETDDSDEMDVHHANEKEIKEGSLVIAEFTGGKRNSTKYSYFCTVQQIEGSLIKVVELKCAKV